jgi:hypothetical protein
MFSVRLQWSLYGLKQSGGIWFNRLSNFLLQRGYINNDDCPCVFIKKSCDGFCIISLYVDDLNIIGTTRDIEEAMAYLKTEFDMEDLGKTKVLFGPVARTPPRRMVCSLVYLYKEGTRKI